MRLRKRSRESSWTLSRFATDGCRIPSSRRSGTSWTDPDRRGHRNDDHRVEEPTQGIAVRTMTGRVLSRSASQTSPDARRRSREVVGVQRFPIGVVADATSVAERCQRHLVLGRWRALVCRDVARRRSAWMSWSNATSMASEVEPTPSRARAAAPSAVQRNGCLLSCHTIDTTLGGTKWEGTPSESAERGWPIQMPLVMDR